MESSAIKQARQSGFLLTQGDTAHSAQLIATWGDECDQNDLPSIRVAQKGKFANLVYVLKRSPANAWSETLMRDVEGFLVVELQAGTLESTLATRRGVFGPLQGQLYDLDFRQALHIAKRLALLVRESAEFERPKESEGIGGGVVYVGTDAKNQEHVSEYLRTLGGINIQTFDSKESGGEHETEPA